jgi:hypothetical protein
MAVEDIAFRHQYLAGVLNDGASYFRYRLQFQWLYHGIRSAGATAHADNIYKNTYGTAALVFDDNTEIANSTFTNIALPTGKAKVPGAISVSVRPAPA